MEISLRPARQQGDKLTDIEILKTLVPYLLPPDDKSAWRTMSLAVSLLIASKLLNVQVFPALHAESCIAPPPSGQH